MSGLPGSVRPWSRYRTPNRHRRRRTAHSGCVSLFRTLLIRSERSLGVSVSMPTDNYGQNSRCSVGKIASFSSEAAIKGVTTGLTFPLGVDRSFLFAVLAHPWLSAKEVVAARASAERMDHSSPAAAFALAQVTRPHTVTCYRGIVRMTCIHRRFSWDSLF